MNYWYLQKILETTVCKLFVLDKNTYKHITLPKNLKNNYSRNVNINLQWMQFLNLKV